MKNGLIQNVGWLLIVASILSWCNSKTEETYNDTNNNAKQVMECHPISKSSMAMCKDPVI